jgi:hypothetical protein
LTVWSLLQVITRSGSVEQLVRPELCKEVEDLHEFLQAETMGVIE